MNESRSLSELRPGPCPTADASPGSRQIAEVAAWNLAVDRAVRAVSDALTPSDAEPAELADTLAAVARATTDGLAGRRLVYVTDDDLRTPETGAAAPDVCVPIATVAGPDAPGHLHLLLADEMRPTAVEVFAVHVIARAAVDLASRRLRDVRWDEVVRRAEADASAAQEKAEQLTAALLSSRDIGMAMGILMASEKVTADEAFAWLRTASQDTNRKLREIAVDVVLTGAPPVLARPLGPSRRQP